MKNIVLTRIDDRLLHGQVIVSWIPYLRADEVIVIDDEYANDDFMSLLIKNAAPENVKVNVLSLNEASDYLKKEDEGTRILVLIKDIRYIKMLLNLNISLGKINVGNLGSGPRRSKYYNTVHLTNEELELLKEIAKISEVEFKMLPNEKAFTLE